MATDMDDDNKNADGDGKQWLDRIHHHHQWLLEP